MTAQENTPMPDVTAESSPALPVEAVAPVSAAIRARYDKVKATTYNPGTPAEQMKEGKLQGLNTALAIAMVIEEDAASSTIQTVGGWRPISEHDGSGDSVLAICATAYTPTAFEAWFFDGAWRLYSRGGEKQSSGVTKWFPTHWMPKTALSLPVGGLGSSPVGDTQPGSEGAVVGWPEVTDAWANTYCELTGRDPDGQQVTFVDGGVVTTFRDIAKREIGAMLCAAPKPAIRMLAAAPAHPGADVAVAGDDGWIEWAGGENPVPGQMVDVRTRGEAAARNYSRDIRQSEAFIWTRRADGREQSGDIVAYRLAAPSPKGGA